jgi:hypothetical protein
MEAMRDCPFWASSDVEVVVVDGDPQTLAVEWPECGATGPRSLSSDRAQAVFAWNQRTGRLSGVK